MRLLAVLLLASAANAATISIDLGKVVHVVKQRHDKVPPSVKWRRITAAMASAATLGDLVTTRRGNARGVCETNPLLLASDGCKADPVKLGVAKGAILGWLLVGEEVAHKLPHGTVWDKENIVLNLGMASWFGFLSIHNELQ